MNPLSKSKLSLPSLPHKSQNSFVTLQGKSSTSIVSFTEKIRIRNYVSLYSSKKVLVHKDPANGKNPDFQVEEAGNKSVQKKNSLKFPIGTQDDTSFSSLSLQRKCSDLTYEIQKALSDKLELIRDIATYEYSFSKTCRVEAAVTQLHDWAKKLPDKGPDSEIAEITDKVQSSFSELLWPKTSQIAYVPETEDFGIKQETYSKTKLLLFRGSFVISDVPCILKISGTKWLEEVEIILHTLTGLTFTYFLKFNSSTIYQSQEELFEVLNSNYISKLYLIISHNNELELMFDDSHSEKFKVINYFIRGFGKCSLMLTVDVGQLNIQVLEQKEVLEVPKEILALETLKNLNIKEVKRIVNTHIYYDNRTKGFYWQDELDLATIFHKKENKSKMMNDEFLKETLSMKNFKIIYSFFVLVGEIEFKVDMLVFKEQVKCKISTDVESIEIPQESRNFKALSEMQSIDILTNPSTLQKSLEIQVLIKKQFPRLPYGKSK